MIWETRITISADLYNYYLRRQFQSVEHPRSAFLNLWGAPSWGGATTWGAHQHMNMKKKTIITYKKSCSKKEKQNDIHSYIR